MLQADRKKHGMRRLPVAAPSVRLEQRPQEPHSHSRTDGITDAARVFDGLARAYGTKPVSCIHKPVTIGQTRTRP